MNQSIYCSLIPNQDEEVQIVETESTHMLYSRRLIHGNQNSITDGKGTLEKGVIVNISSNQKALVIKIQIHTIYLRFLVRKILASALQNSKKQSTMLDMSTQIWMNDFFLYVVNIV